MTTRRWIRISLSLPGSYQDLLVGPLAALGFEGFLQEDHALEAYIELGKWNGELRGRLSYYLQKFGQEFPTLKLNFRTSVVTRRNWNRTWEQSIHILDATPRIVIKPSWRKLRARDKGKIVLHIDPKMSFGTGHHETTRLCLLLLEEYIVPKANILDFGSGTGILAIAAIKLGAQRAVAIDNDEWTIPNIRENISRNGVSRKITAVLGSTDRIPKEQYDLIIANIDLPTITNTYRALLRRLRKGGILLLSGVLTADCFKLYNLLAQSGVSPINLIEENEWSAIALVKM